MGCEGTSCQGRCPEELAHENACPGHGRSARSVIVFITNGNWEKSASISPTTAQSRLQHQFQLLTIILSL